MKKIVIAIFVILTGFGLATFGLFSLKSLELKNSALEKLKDRPAESLKIIQKFNSKAADVQFILSLAYFRSGNLKKSEEILTQIIIDPKTPNFWRVRALYNLGNLYVVKGMRNQDQSALKNAIFYYQESLRLDPTFWLSKYNLERLVKEDPRASKKEKETGEEDQGKPKKKDDSQNQKPNLNPPPNGLP